MKIHPLAENIMSLLRGYHAKFSVGKALMQPEGAINRAVREYLEGMAADINVSSGMLHPECTWLNEIRRILGILQKPEWCEHILWQKQMRSEEYNGWWFEDGNIVLGKDNIEEWKLCPVCGKERPKI